MKVLLVGCGSAGKRHLRNLIALDRVKKIYVYSKVKNCLSGLKDKNKVSFTGSLDGLRADLAIIANETYQHVDTALTLAGKGIHLFIEKPLSHSLSGKLGLLKRMISRNKLKLTVGYNLRFLGAIKFIKNILAKGTLGDIYFVRIEAGQYLPDWRKGRDYRDSYSASKIRGGGVALDLSHEIDYMRYFFGDPDFFRAIKARAGDLKIDSESVFEGIYLYGKFICSVHMDYLQKDKKRIIRIEASRGSLVCDLINKKIIMMVNGKRKIIADKKLFDFDKSYIRELVSFIRAVENGHKPEVTFEDGVRVLELIKDKYA